MQDTAPGTVRKTEGGKQPVLSGLRDADQVAGKCPGGRGEDGDTRGGGEHAAAGDMKKPAAGMKET